MPDKSKMEKLADVGYVLFLETCGLCQYGWFPPGRDFGSCSVYEYTHEKHGPPPRKLSVHRCGGCRTGGFHVNQKKETSITHSGFLTFAHVEGSDT